MLFAQSPCCYYSFAYTLLIKVLINQTSFLALQVVLQTPQKSERDDLFVTDNNKCLNIWINSAKVQITLCVTRVSQRQCLLGNTAVKVIPRECFVSEDKRRYCIKNQRQY